MTIKELVKHQWLKAVRSPGFYRNLTVNIIIGILGLYFASVFILVGIELDRILKESIPQHTPIDSFSGILMYLFITGLLLRFMMQGLNRMNIQPYQVLPIKRAKFVNYIILKPVLNPVNYWFLLIVIPFALTTVKQDMGTIPAMMLIIVCVLFIAFNILFSSYLKRKFGSTFWSIVILLILGGGFVFLDHFKIFSLFEVSKMFFGYLIKHPIGLLIASVFPLVAYILNVYFFKNNFYSEAFNRHMKGQRFLMREITIFDRLGEAGNLMAIVPPLNWRGFSLS